jgi:cobalt-precorrin 5A hydrolase
MIVAGIGCRTGVVAEAVVALVQEAGALVAKIVIPGLVPGTDPFGRRDGVEAPHRVGPRNECAGDEVMSVLAVPAFRQGERGIAEAAKRLNLPILWIERDALRGEQGRCLTRSARAEAEVGLSCVAEAAALFAAGPGSRLILPRIVGGGVTCAFAEGPAPRAPAEGLGI